MFLDSWLQSIIFKLLVSQLQVSLPAMEDSTYPAGHTDMISWKLFVPTRLGYRTQKQYISIHTVYKHLFQYMVQHWCYGTVLVLSYSTGVMVEYWCYGTALVLWYSTGVMVQHWCYGTVLVFGLVYSTGVMVQYWCYGTVLVLWYSTGVWFSVQHWCYGTVLSGVMVRY